MSNTNRSTVDWVRGDLLGHDVPVHLDALREAGPEYLTSALRAAGSLDADGAVTSIAQLEPVGGGSTGRKALLAVTYRGDRNLPAQLFVKFSRDLDDELRDRGKRQMESEVRFGLLSNITRFPVAVPRCLFGDYHLESGSGILISERIAFGEDGIEPHHPKARDYEIPDLADHYDALVSSLARLAGSHRAGRFPIDLMEHVAPRRPQGRVKERPATTTDQALGRIERYVAFADRCPQLLPPAIRSEGFLTLLQEQVPRAVEHADLLREAGRDGASRLTAFCHWNANIDNAWFWREDTGQLRCGLLDWGNAGQMSMVTALASCLTFAEPDFVVERLDHLLELFATEVEAAGGGRIDPAELRQDFDLHMVVGGLQWPLGAVALLERHLPDIASIPDRLDPRIADDEFPRTQLQLLATSLALWAASDPAGVLDRVLRRAVSA